MAEHNAVEDDPWQLDLDESSELSSKALSGTPPLLLQIPILVSR